MNIKKFQHSNWIKRWAGSYTFISCSYWGTQYKYSLEKILNKGFDNVLFIHRQGTVSFFLEKNEFEKFGNFLAKKTIQDEKTALKLLDELKENTDRILKIMKELHGKIPTQQEYSKFLEIFENHLAYHNFMKKTVDFLPNNVPDKLIKIFKDARIYSEAVYSETESFFIALAKTIAKKENYNPNLLTCLLQEEIEEYLSTRKLPPLRILNERYKASALFFDKGKLDLIIGKEVDIIENSISKNQIKIKDGAKGITAYPGIVKGVCRVILNPTEVSEFNKGDVLITGMTRPEFIPLIKKASAIVTDAGGVLCHAAITAREMKIPCIVGTENVTKMFQDGDKVVVDAQKGIIKKIKD